MCPITQEPMTDPVTAADGHNYERAAIEGGCSGVCRVVAMHAARCCVDFCELSALAQNSSLLCLHMPLLCLTCPPTCTAAWIKRQTDAKQAPCSPLTNLPLEHLRLCPSPLVGGMIASMRAAGLLTP